MTVSEAGQRPLAEWERHQNAYPTVSFIVVNYRRPLETIACVRSVAALRYPGRVEIVVVENGSGDQSLEIIQAAILPLTPDAVVLKTSLNLGFAGGVLTGWEKTTGDLVCLLNNDATVHPDALTRLVDHLRGRTDLGAVWPYDAPMSWETPQQELSVAERRDMRGGTVSVIGSNIWLPILRTPNECFTASGVCLLLVKAVTTPPFPAEYFAYFEDVFLGWHLRLRGLGSERVPNATIYHEGSLTSSSQPELKPLMAFHAEKNRLANLLLFYSPSSLARILPLICLDEFKKLMVLAGMAARGQLRKAWAYARINVKARVWLFTRLRWLASQRRFIQANRGVGDDTLFPLMSARLSADASLLAQQLNRVSLWYCQVAGINAVECGPRGPR